MARHPTHRRVYFIPFKLRVNTFSSNHSVRMTARKYNIDRKMVKLLKKNNAKYRSKNIFLK